MKDSRDNKLSAPIDSSLSHRVLSPIRESDSAEDVEVIDDMDPHGNSHELPDADSPSMLFGSGFSILDSSLRWGRVARNFFTHSCMGPPHRQGVGS